MLPPHELKNKKFTHAIRGYSTAEVDDYVEFILERYAEVYRKNSQLEKDIRALTVKLEELVEKEDAINRALVNAQKIEDKLIGEANEKAEILTRAAKTNADKILNDFHKKITKERAVLHSLRQQVAEFRSYVLAQYEENIESIKRLAPPIYEEPEWETDPEEYTEKVISGIRDAANQAAENGENKQKLERILQAHTENVPVAPVVVKKSADEGENKEGEKAVQAAKSQQNTSKNDEKTELVLEPAKVEETKPAPSVAPAVKRRPKPRRTIEAGGTSDNTKKTVAPVKNDDTEKALDRLFNEGSAVNDRRK